MSQATSDVLFHTLVIGGVQMNFFKAPLAHIEMPVPMPGPLAAFFQMKLTHRADLFHLKIHEINPVIQDQIIAQEEGATVEFRRDEPSDANLLFDAYIGVGDMGQAGFSAFQFAELPKNEEGYEPQVTLGMMMNSAFPMSNGIEVVRLEDQTDFPGARTFLDRLNSVALVFLTKFLIQPGDETYSFASNLPTNFFDNYTADQILWVSESPVGNHVRTVLAPYWEVFKNKQTTEE